MAAPQDGRTHKLVAGLLYILSVYEGSFWTTEINQQKTGGNMESIESKRGNKTIGRGYEER